MSTGYVGVAGQLAVMSELAIRGYNVSIPLIDVGDDIFVVNDTTAHLWRVQAKTSNSPTANAAGTHMRHQFNVKEPQIQTPGNPDLTFAFVFRLGGRFRYLIVPRTVLLNYVNANGVGSLNAGKRQLYLSVNNAGTQAEFTAGQNRVDVTHHLEDWAMWPDLQP